MQPPTTIHNHPQPPNNYAQQSAIFYNHSQYTPTTIHNHPQPSTATHNKVPELI